MRTKRPAKLLVALCLFALAAAGCGSEESGSPPPLPTAPSSSGTGDTGGTTPTTRPTVTVAASADSMTAGDAAGVTVMATVKDADGNPAEGVEVSFSTDLGVLDGAGTSATKTTGADGTASVVLTSTEAGSARIRATAEGLTRSVTVSVVAGPVATLSLSAEPTTAQADGESTIQITATAKDAYGNPSGVGNVTLTADLGTFEGTGGGQTISAPLLNGLAVATLVAPSSSGTATVSATADNGTTDAADDVTAEDLSISFTPTPPPELGTYSLAASGTEFGAGGCALFTLTALDVNGLAIKGESVTFTADGGALFLDGCEAAGGDETVETVTDLSGKARAYLRVPTVAGSVAVSAASTRIGGFDRATVAVVAAAPVDAGMTVRVLPVNLTADGTSEAQGTVEVRDVYGNPVDTTVNLSVTDTSDVAAPNLGRVEPAQVAVLDGVGTFTFVAGTEAGTARVRATAPNGATAAADVTLISVPVATVTLEASAGEVTADGTTTVVLTAEVKDAQGNPVAAGTEVSFSTDLGTVVDESGAEISTAPVNELGRATAYLRSGRNLGVAQVVATAGGKSATVEVAFVAGAPAAVTVEAVPGNLTADGASQSQVRVLVTDALGNPTDTVLTVSQPGNGSVDRTTVTTSGGMGTFTYTAGATAGTVTLTATASNGVSGSAAVTLIAVPVGSVTLTSDAESIVADGGSRAELTVEVTKATGGPADGVAVSLSSSLGTLEDLAGNPITEVMTDGLGRATAYLRSGRNLGVAQVVATAGGKSATVEVAFVAGAPADLLFTVSPANITGDGASQATVRVEVRDGNGNPADTVVTVESPSVGTVTPASVATAGGVASFTYTSGRVTANQSVLLTFRTSNGVREQIGVTLIPEPVGSVEVTAEPATLEAGETATLTIRVLGTSGEPVEGVAPTVTTSLGSLTGGGLTDANGETTVSLTSDTPGTASVTATAGGKSASASVAFVAGEPATVLLTAWPPNLAADGQSTAQIRAEVRDANGNPSDTVLRFEIVKSDGTAITDGSMGAVSPPQVSTGGGEATVTYTAGRTPGGVYIRATAANGTESGVSSPVLTLEANPVGTLEITASPPSVVADGSSEAVLTVRVADENGNPIEGASVAWTTDLGTLSTNSSTTDGLGNAQVTLTSSVLGVATVTATAGGQSASAEVTFVPGPPATILATVSPSTLVADGVQTATIRCVVLDAQNHRVADETPVNFDVSLDASSESEGALSAYAAETAGGEVTVTYTAPVGAGDGTATVTIGAGSATKSVDIGLSDETVGTVSLAVADATLPADGNASTAVTVTVRNTRGALVADGTAVTLSATSGSFAPAGPYTTVNGEVAVSYVAGTTAGPVVITASAGGVSQSANLTLEAGPVANLTITPSLSRIPPDGATPSILTLRAEDANGNPVNTSVNLSTTLGVLWTEGPASPVSSIALVNGEGTVNLTADQNGTASVTVSASGVIATEDIEVGFTSSGDPANILMSWTDDKVTVAGVGENELATLNITVVDEGGNPITDSADNVTVEILEGPNAGETIAGVAMGSTATLTTVNGRVSADFRSGTAPGTVRVRVTVGTLTATSPKILVVAGPPYSVVLGRAPEPESNGDGTYTHEYFALVTDQYGNAVPDGTAVYFGLVHNDKGSGSDGQLHEAADTFDTVSATNFETAGVVPGDTLLIEGGTAEGGYIVESVSGIVLGLFADVQEDLTALPYRVGNSFGGGEITPVAATDGGVATAEMTYPRQLVKDPVWVYAETSGRAVGDVEEFVYTWPRPTTLTVVGPSDAITGGIYPITVIVEDGSSPANRLEGIDVTIEDTNGWRVSGTTDVNGEVTVDWTAPATGGYRIIVTAEDGTQETVGVTVH